MEIYNGTATLSKNVGVLGFNNRDIDFLAAVKT